MNDLLALLAYEGVGNKKAREYDNSQQFINWPPEGPLSPSEDKVRAKKGGEEQETVQNVGESVGGLKKSGKSGEKQERLLTY